jgi:hypothetical protein
MICPGCSGKGKLVKGTSQIYKCRKCKGIFGTCYLGESYSYVLPYMSKVEPPAENLRYFDFECLGSQGITRRHGWYDSQTKLVVQTG